MITVLKLLRSCSRRQTTGCSGATIKRCLVPICPRGPTRRAVQLESRDPRRRWIVRGVQAALLVLVAVLAVLVLCSAAWLWRMNELVGSAATDGAADSTKDMAVVHALGGEEDAAWKLRLYCGAPNRVARHKGVAERILVCCGSHGARYFAMQLNSGDSRVRANAATSLSCIADPGDEAVRALTKGLADSQWEVRVASARALGSIGGGARSAVPKLLRGLRDPEGVVRKEAALALSSIDPGNEKLVREVRPWKNSRDFVARLTAAQVMQRAGLTSRDAAGWFAALLSDEHRHVRITAVRALGDMGSHAKEAVPVLVKMLKDDDEGLRFSVSQALKKIKAAQEKKK